MKVAGADDSVVSKQGHVQGMALVGYVFEGGAPTAGAAAEDGAAEIQDFAAEVQLDLVRLHHVR